MMSAGGVFPYSSSESRVEAANNVSSERCCSSLTAHIITALVVAIVVGGIGAAIAAHFIAQHQWTIVAGVSGFTVAGMVTFIALRCCFGTSDPVPAPMPTPTAPIKIPETVRPIKTAPIKTVPSNPTRMDRGRVIVDQKSLPNLIQTVDGQTEYYDPTNELPIEPAHLYQEMLTHPACGDKRDMLLDLLAAELLKMSYRGEVAFIHPHLTSLDAETIQALGTRVPDHAGDLQEELLIRGVEIAACQAEIVNQLNVEMGPGHFYLGAARGDGGCLFHSMAQLLSVHFGRVITEKTLRMQCYHYLQHPKNTHYRVGPKDLESLQHSSSETREPSEGETDVHAEIIANLYGVTFCLHEARIYQETVIESAGHPIRPKQEISLSDIGYEEVGKGKGDLLRFASTQGHFFPIWPLTS